MSWSLDNMKWADLFLSADLCWWNVCSASWISRIQVELPSPWHALCGIDAASKYKAASINTINCIGGQGPLCQAIGDWTVGVDDGKEREKVARLGVFLGGKMEGVDPVPMAHILSNLSFRSLTIHHQNGWYQFEQNPWNSQPTRRLSNYSPTTGHDWGGMLIELRGY